MTSSCHVLDDIIWTLLLSMYCESGSGVPVIDHPRLSFNFFFQFYKEYLLCIISNETYNLEMFCGVREITNNSDMVIMHKMIENC